MHTGRHVPLGVVDVDIPSDEHGLGKLDHFNGDKQRDWYHVREQEDPGEESLQEDNEERPLWQFQIICRVLVDRAPIGRVGSCHEAENAFDEEDDDDGLSDEDFEVGELLLRTDRVAHDTGVVAGIADHPDDPVGVAQTRTTQE